MFLDVIPPEKLLSIYDHFQNLLRDKRLKPKLKSLAEHGLEMLTPIDIRCCHQRDLQSEPVWPAREFSWIETLEPLPHHSHIHRSNVAYYSD